MLKVHDDVWVDESELYLLQPEAFRDLFDRCSPARVSRTSSAPISLCCGSTWPRTASRSLRGASGIFSYCTCMLCLFLSSIYLSGVKIGQFPTAENQIEYPRRLMYCAHLKWFSTFLSPSGFTELHLSGARARPGFSLIIRAVVESERNHCLFEVSSVPGFPRSPQIRYCIVTVMCNGKCRWSDTCAAT